MEDQSRDPVDYGLSTTSFLRDRVILGRSFPTGVLIEILTRLPIKALVQFQLVCKDWGTLIHEQYFKEKHLDRSKVISHWHNYRLPGNDPNSDPFVYRHGCNGLLLVMKGNQRKHYIWNPAIRRALELPDPQQSSKGFAFSYVPATKSYRIVSFYDGNGSLACEVITPGGNSVWRQLDLPEIENKGVVKREAVVQCGGAAHYVLVTELGQVEFPRIDIVSLDLVTESFVVTCFPDLSGQLRRWKNCWELDWDGKLGFADVVGENLEVMVLEDYKSGRWCDKKIVVHLNFLNKSMVIPLFMEKGEICFYLKDEKIFRYTVKTGRCTDCLRRSLLLFSSKVHPLKLSLISLEGMVPDNPEFDNFRSKVC